jgi:hypothetical protein
VVCGLHLFGDLAAQLAVGRGWDDADPSPRAHLE